MTAVEQPKKTHAPNIQFSHFGFATSDLPKMVDFYTRVLGFSITDKGFVEGMDLVFMSRDPQDHHQIVLVSGRPDNLPPHPYNPQFGSVINQIAFKVGSLASLREVHEILREEGAESIFPANHGIAWSVYAHDPEGNNLEFFVDSDWYFPQPFLEPLDMSLTDEEIYALTEEISRTQEGFQPFDQWRSTISKGMNLFRPEE